MDRTDLGRRLYSARKSRGWSLREAGERAGIRFTYVHDIEQGRKNPTLDVLERLAELYGLRARIDLLDDQEVPLPPEDVAALDEIRAMLPGAPEDLKAAVLVMLRAVSRRADRTAG